MSLVPRRRCDVFMSHKNVSRYRLTIVRIGDDGELWRESDDPVRVCLTDLSERGLKRLLALIDKGVRPPGAKEEEAVDSKTEPTK